MTGPAVDVEQLTALRPVIDWLRVDRPRPFDELPESLKLRWLGKAVEVADLAHPALLDLIRRQDAALTAVRELADKLDNQADTIWQRSNDYDGNGMPLASAACRSQARAYRDARARITAALASPDTTQEDQP